MTDGEHIVWEAVTPFIHTFKFGGNHFPFTTIFKLLFISSAKSAVSKVLTM